MNLQGINHLSTERNGNQLVMHPHTPRGLVRVLLLAGIHSGQNGPLVTAQIPPLRYLS
jgi:hypothetical protein